MSWELDEPFDRTEEALLGGAILLGTVVLEGVGLTKTYRRGPEEIHAVRGADLEIRAGEVVALAGPSGSGKTTLLNLLVGWEHPDAGEVRWSGATVRPETLPWSGVAIVPQSLGLVEELTVRENVELPIRLGGSPTVGGPDGRVEALLAALGLAALADRLPAETSLGEQQRTALARALVLEPSLLVADEPTGHQDVVWTRGVLSVLRRSADGGTACLIATHHRALVRYADRVMGIRDGEIEPVDPDEVAAGDEL